MRPVLSPDGKWLVYATRHKSDTGLRIRNHGRFGCAHDYDAFKPDLLPLMESVHGDTRHSGKTPRRAPRAKTAQAELAQLRQRLQSLVNEENYEEAARVRDRIKELENPA